MTATPNTAAAPARRPQSPPPATATRRLLIAGAAAGPLYILIAAGQVLARDGFDVRQHAVSLLANGDRGWVQIANFLLAGVLTIAGAVGIRRALPPGPGRGWAPRLLGAYGASLLAAGAFVADPAAGFPAGTPAGLPLTLSWHGTAHLLAGGIGFLALIAACLIFTRRFATHSQQRWAAYSATTGVAFFAAFAGIASGAQSAAIHIAFTSAVVAAWAWLTALTVHLLRASRSAHPQTA
jgi:hypothetical protein